MLSGELYHYVFLGSLCNERNGRLCHDSEIDIANSKRILFHVFFFNVKRRFRCIDDWNDLLAKSVFSSVHI